MEIKIIESIDEMREHGVVYAHRGSPSKWIKIELETDGTFYVYGHVSGSHPTSIGNGNMVKTWRTFKGVIKYLKICTENGNWGMRRFKLTDKH